MCGSDGVFNSMDEAMVCNFDGTVIAAGGSIADEIVTTGVRPDLVREARQQCENNLYQFGHPGFTAGKGGAQDCRYTHMHELVAARYRLPWEDQVLCTDGASCGFPAPERHYKEKTYAKLTNLSG